MGGGGKRGERRGGEGRPRMGGEEVGRREGEEAYSYDFRMNFRTRIMQPFPSTDFHFVTAYQRVPLF